jgi:hypothetical protein
MTQTATYSQFDAESVSGCHECPLSRHINGDRFACADRQYATTSRHAATQECHEAILEYPRKYFTPIPLPSFQGISAERICDQIGLSVNWLDTDEDQAPGGRTLISVTLSGHKIGGINKVGNWYHCDRNKSVSSRDAHGVALRMIDPDLFYGVAEEIKSNQIDVDYI